MRALPERNMNSRGMAVRSLFSWNHPTPIQVKTPASGIHVLPIRNAFALGTPHPLGSR